MVEASRTAAARLDLRDHSDSDPVRLHALLQLPTMEPAPPGTRQWVGLDNYGKVFTDDLFRNAVVNTGGADGQHGAAVPGHRSRIRLDPRPEVSRPKCRRTLLTPFLVMPTAAALVWKTSMYNPVFGLINWFLSPFGVGNVDWVSQFPMLSIIIVLTWQWTPFMMLIIPGRPTEPVAGNPRGGPCRRCQRLGHFPPDHAAPSAPVPRALRDARRHLHRRDFRRDLHDHPGGPGQATTNALFIISRHFGPSRWARLQPPVIVVAVTIIIATFALRVVSSLFAEEAG